MSRRCTVCSHPKRAEIDAAIVGGGVIRDIARRFDVSKDALCRHRDGHLAAHLLTSHKAAEVLRADVLIERVESLVTSGEALIEHGQGGDVVSVKAWAAGIREARLCLELLAKLRGQLSDGLIINIASDAGWIALRAQILDALESYPEARRTLAEVLNAG